MKPVRRKIRRHFGLTAKQVAVRSQRPWYFQWAVSAVFIAVGYFAAYWQFSGSETLGKKLGEQLKQVGSENQSLQTKIIQVERQLQIEQAAQNNLDKELNLVQDENIKIKEDLLFYKNMVASKRRFK